MANYVSEYSGQQLEAKLAEIANKQNTLVSGSNIKTINNQSILGSGNISIDNNIFVATPNVTTYSELLAAMQAGKYICLYEFSDYESSLQWVHFIEEDDGIFLITSSASIEKQYFVSTQDVWSLEHSYTYVTDNDIDQTYNASSIKAQSGTAVASAVSGKQDTLVSGTNIKTINNNSILGDGNIDITGGVSDVTVDGTSVVSSGIAAINLSSKQDTLTAGTGIDITNNVISIDLPRAEGGQF